MLRLFTGTGNKTDFLKVNSYFALLKPQTGETLQNFSNAPANHITVSLRFVRTELRYKSPYRNQPNPLAFSEYDVR